MSNVELYQENVLAKVGGRWALVSRRTHQPLAYWRGHGKPPSWWVSKQEQRVQFFKHAHDVENPDAAPTQSVVSTDDSGGGTAFFVLAGLALVGGAGYLLYTLSQKPQLVTPANFTWPNDVGKSISLKVGQALNVALPAFNASTGFGWTFAGGDQTIVRPLFDPSLNGGTFTFQGQSAGTTTLVFNNSSAGGQVASSFSITVTVS